MSAPSDDELLKRAMHEIQESRKILTTLVDSFYGLNGLDNTNLYTTFYKARKFLYPETSPIDEEKGVCLLCGSGVILHDPALQGHIRNDLPPCFGELDAEG